MECTSGISYSVQHLKRKLIEKYEDHIVFASVSGRRDVLCFRDMCSYVLNDKWYSKRKGNITDDAERIVETAAKLIAS